MNRGICYLCGKVGADDRDHVPARAFLGTGNYAGASRIVLPSHGQCNRGFSSDEEYVRDLLAPAAEQLRLPGTQTLRAKADRALQRPAGRKRRQEFLKSAGRVSLYSSAGLYIGKAIGVRSDKHRVNRVGEKIARGIIYHDTGAIIAPGNIVCGSLPLQDVLNEKERELNKQNPYWVNLSLDKAHPVVPGWSICSIRVPCAGDQRRARGGTGRLGRDR